VNEEIKAVRQLIASMPKTDEMSVEEYRAFMDKAAASFRLPRGVSVESTDADGVPGEWVKAAGVDSTLEIWEGMIHVWHSFAPMLQEGRQAIARIGEFFKAHLIER
jgi:hypothetical protein